ncbi:MAG: hypothetical protein ASARMPREDX12_003018 [Alectoria sarmentosa]|nr:MAG: hypothetical protein ASARMPREDX12_003018 [Alectoria sarmentosa]
MAIDLYFDSDLENLPLGMFRKAVFVIILLPFCDLVPAIPAISRSFLPIVDFANALHNPNPPNGTRTGPPSLNARAPEPLELTTDWPGLVTVTFSNYGAPMFRPAAIGCVTDASQDAWFTHGDDMDHVIGKNELVYSHFSVIFTVLPCPAMTWNMLCWMIELVTEFVEDYDPLAFEFDVDVVGIMGLAASGNMTSLPDI